MSEYCEHCYDLLMEEWSRERIEILLALTPNPAAHLPFYALTADHGLYRPCRCTPDYEPPTIYQRLTTWEQVKAWLDKGEQTMTEDRYFECENCGQVVQGWHASQQVECCEAPNYHEIDGPDSE